MVYSFGAQLNMFGSRAHEARFKLLDRKDLGIGETGPMTKSSSFAGTPNFDQVEVSGLRTVLSTRRLVCDDSGIVACKSAAIQKLHCFRCSRAGTTSSVRIFDHDESPVARLTGSLAQRSTSKSVAAKKFVRIPIEQ